MNIIAPILLAAGLAALQPAASGAPFVDAPVLAPGTHASGGISEEDREEMRQKQGLYTLHLAFAEARSGAYLAGITLLIEPLDRGAPLGPYADCGPLFNVALRPGAYRVTAIYQGATRTKTVRVGKAATQATLYWPEPGDS
ncbi:hypothetical protein [Variovorax sp. JS1663]|uniref:hypothetical protein n=1 Tax=Variovorax sp. JS1663 TaxID=1851577 RepID=UPI000B348E23|nr:hypothetical protein [Variovorax sp. JS1663]OUM00922.1 hypothetical protein A8M77_18640 [Variovorax sp. JS1663]